MAVKDKKQCPVRLHYKVYSEIREKTREDEINFQTLADILFVGYLRNDKGVRALVEKYKRNRSTKKGAPKIGEMEKHDLLRYIESNISPIGALEKKIKNDIQEKKKNEQVLYNKE